MLPIYTIYQTFDSALNCKDRLVSIFFLSAAQVDDSHAFSSIHRSQHYVCNSDKICSDFVNCDMLNLCEISLKDFRELQFD